MSFPGSPPPRIKIVSGWRAVILAAGILATIALIAFLAFSTMVIIVPLMFVGAVVSLFFPKPKIVPFRRTRPQASNVIEGDYRVVETSKGERKDGRSFGRSDEK